MLKDKIDDRPKISDVNDWLYMFGRRDAIYYGKRCPRGKHPPNFFGESSEIWWDRISHYSIEEYFVCMYQGAEAKIIHHVG